MFCGCNKEFGLSKPFLWNYLGLKLNGIAVITNWLNWTCSKQIELTYSSLLNWNAHIVSIATLDSISKEGENDIAYKTSQQENNTDYRARTDLNTSDV